MEERRFDELTRALSTATSRRQVLKGFLGGVVAAIVGGAVAIPRAEAAGCSKKDCKEKAIRETFLYQNSTCNDLCHDPKMAFACFGCQLNANRLYKKWLRDCEQGDGCLGMLGEVCCFSECVNTGNDSRNCGACGHACAPGEVCKNGQCTCGDKGTMCDGHCVDTQIDAQHCGSCDHKCGTCQTCVGGQCVAVDCGSGNVCCKDQCVATCPSGKQLDPGTCECICEPKTCSPGEVLNTTTCQCLNTCVGQPDGTTCAPGEMCCGQQCVDVQFNDGHCGDCATQCATCETCQNGTCVQAADNTTCGNGLVCCSGVCQESCSSTCPSGQYVCQVTPPYTNNNNQRPATICCPNGSPCCGGNGYFYDLCQPTTSDPTGVCCSPGTNQCGSECCDHLTQSCQQASDYSLHCCPAGAGGVLPDGTCCAAGSSPVNCEGAIGWVCCDYSAGSCCG